MYDSTDIWMAVFGELRKGTNYGQRTAKSALDLAWTIADQARAVFHKRTLHPQLQFIEMFEMEINEIVRLRQILHFEIDANGDFARLSIRLEHSKHLTIMSRPRIMRMRSVDFRYVTFWDLYAMSEKYQEPDWNIEKFSLSSTI